MWPWLAVSHCRITPISSIQVHRNIIQFRTSCLSTIFENLSDNTKSNNDKFLSNAYTTSCLEFTFKTAMSTRLVSRKEFIL